MGGSEDSANASSRKHKEVYHTIKGLESNLLESDCGRGSGDGSQRGAYRGVLTNRCGAALVSGHR